MSNSTRSSFDLARSKAKLLTILPDLAEEEDFQGISPSSFLKPRRPVRPARPARPLLDLYLDFPTPPEPVSLARSRATKLLPMRFRKPNHSPASSISSSSAASFMSNVSSELSPATSEDDEAVSSSAPVSNFKPSSVAFSKSLPDLPRFSDNLNHADLESDEESDGEDLEWIVQEMKDFISVATSLPDDSANPRPESFLPPRSPQRQNHVFSHGPSAQLDPTFPFKQLVSIHPPPVSSKSLPSLHSPSSSTSSSSSSTTTASIRPPPRSSLPRDVDELMQMDLNDFEMIEGRFTREWHESLYSDYHGSPLISLGFDVDDLPKRKSSFFDNAMPDSPIESMYSPESSIHQSLASPLSSPHQLSSRWSSSTVASQKQQHSSSPFWLTKFTLRGKKYKAASPPPLPPLPPAAMAAQKQKHRRFNGADLIRARFESEEQHRSDSRSSRTSAESNASAPSVGLKRQPIPIKA